MKAADADLPPPPEGDPAALLRGQLVAGQAALSGGRWSESESAGEAVHALAAVAQLPELAAEGALLAARSAFNLGRLDVAEAWCEKTRLPEASLAQNAAGWVVTAAVRARRDDAHGAIDAANQALLGVTDELPAAARRTVYYGLAIALSALGLWSQAMGAWRAAVEADIGMGTGRSGLAMSRLNLIENALRAHDDVHGVDPRKGLALLAEARLIEQDIESDLLLEASAWVRYLSRHASGALARRDGRPEVAAALLRAAIDDPVDAPTALRGSFWLELGQAQAALGDAAGARDSATQAVALLDADRSAPEEAHPLWTLHDLWRAHRLAGDEGQALARLETYHQRRMRNQLILLDSQVAGLTRRLSEQTLWLQNADLREANAGLERSIADISRIAQADPLTGILNRRALELAYRELALTARSLVVIMIDIDHFKQVNDRFSHVVGDAVLRRVALLLTDAVRGPDQAGRYGGEEFTVLLANTDAVEAQRVAERLRERVESFDWEASAPGLRVTISLGFVVVRSGEAFEPAVVRADGLLYRAKQDGRNRVVSDAAD